MATKTIGPSGRDFSTMAAYASYLNALTLTAPEVALVDGTVNDTTSVVMNGWTGGSTTNTVTIKAATGQGWNDNASVQTNAFRFNAANGAALINNVGFATGYVFGNNVILQGLQIRLAASSPANTSIAIQAGVNLLLRQCIVDCTGTLVLSSNGTGITLENTLIHQRGTGNGLQLSHAGFSSTNSSIVSNGGGGTGIKQAYAQVPAPIVKNTVVFGFTSDYQNTSNASSTNNATDKTTFGGTGWDTAGQVGLTSADFVNVTAGSEDWRPSSTSKLKNTGAVTSVTVDAAGTSRPQGGSYDIGAWELVAAATAPAAPTIGSATAGATSASVTFTANSNGGSAITSFTATASTGETVTGITASPAVFPTLSAGVARTFHVQAINAIGTSAASGESNSVTPTAPNAAPTFSGTIAAITGTGGSAITPVDVHALFSDTDALTYAASPAGTAWPAGLVINAVTGVISGTVATSTTTGLKVRATDTASQTVDSNGFSVTIGAPSSTVSGVTVSPGTANVAGSGTQAFTASVAGTGSPSQAVNWSTSAGSINSAGVLTAPAATSGTQTVTVTATSAQDGSKSGTATVTVAAASGVTFTITRTMKNIQGGQRINTPVHACIMDMNRNLLATKTGLSTNAAGVVPPFSVNGLSAIPYRVDVVVDANPADFSASVETPA
jgi:hypothetical protein